MKIEILGSGCAKCNTLTQVAEDAAKELGVDYELVKVTDMKKFMAYGVMMTPALVIDGTVKSMGKVPSSDEIKKMLQ
ncbi:MAG: thioredoxin family protein [Fibrobacterota bacterium]